jgi:hypothetical protein
MDSGVPEQVDVQQPSLRPIVSLSAVLGRLRPLRRRLALFGTLRLAVQVIYGSQSISFSFFCIFFPP